MYARKNSQLHHWTLSYTCCCLQLHFQHWKDSGYAVTYWPNRNAAMQLLFNMTRKWLCFNWHDRKMAMLCLTDMTGKWLCFTDRKAAMLYSHDGKMAMLYWQESSYAVLTWLENGYALLTGKQLCCTHVTGKWLSFTERKGKRLCCTHMTGKWLGFIHMQLLFWHERRLYCTDQKGK